MFRSHTKCASKVFFIFISLLTGLLYFSLAQDVQVTLVDTFFTVTDKDGQFIKNLKKEDFVVLDNGVPQQIAKFESKIESPLSLALLIDRSQSVGAKFELEQKAAIKFLNSILHQESDRGLIVAFDSKVYLIQDWTSDVSSLVQAVNKLTVAGGTSLFDAVYKVCRDKFTLDDPRKKVLVLLTDGEDTTSRALFKQALEMAQLSGVATYIIGVKAEDSLNTRELQGKNVLTQLAEMTGGRIFYPKGREDFASLFARLEDELRNQYNISYYLRASLDGTFHKIKIEPRDKSLIVNARKGYYARIPSEEHLK